MLNTQSVSLACNNLHSCHDLAVSDDLVAEDSKTANRDFVCGDVSGHDMGVLARQIAPCLKAIVGDVFIFPSTVSVLVAGIEEWGLVALRVLTPDGAIADIDVPLRGIPPV